jgi:hypothetical protein
LARQLIDRSEIDRQASIGRFTRRGLKQIFQTR